MKLIDEITNSLGHHPYLGAGLSIGQLVAGLLMLIIDGAGVNPIIKDLFQIGAWTGAMLVAGFTIFGVVKTHTTFLDKYKWIKKNKK